MDSFTDNLLFTRADLEAAHDAMNERPLYESATQRLAKAVRDRSVDDLAALVVDLHNDNQLCIPPTPDGTDNEPTIVCTMGLAGETELTVTPRPPWSRRKNRESTGEFFVLRENIPDGLMNSLMDFVEAYFTAGYGVIGQRTEHLARLVDRQLPRKSQRLLEMFSHDKELLLDATDHALKYPDVFEGPHPRDAALTLKSHLDDARSVYDVFKVEGFEYELGYRQPPQITALIEDVTSNQTRAAEHLRRAWSLAFAREPDLNAACIEATKAIEAAARDTVEPKNPTATLGTMIAAMDNKPAKWTTDFASSGSNSLETIIGMMKMVWKGHPRHGNPNEPLDVPTEQCEMIVHTVALLVHWFLSGRVRQA